MIQVLKALARAFDALNCRNIDMYNQEKDISEATN